MRQTLAVCSFIVALAGLRTSDAFPGSLVQNWSSDDSFTVAEVKPHYQCADPAGRDRVRKYVKGLVEDKFGIIAMMQVEFSLEQPPGYTVFGASCVCNYTDPVVVLVDESQFSVVSAIGTTSTGKYSEMPFVDDGRPPTQGSMCAADCKVAGERAYAGAVLRHRSGEEICVIAGTFPHSWPAWGNIVPLSQQFLRQVDACKDRKILFVVDTNARPDNQTVMDIAAQNNVTWGPCSDPGAHGDLTCCNDYPPNSPPSFRFDRTAMCHGGSVEGWAVESDYFCDAREEHRFTKATVRLSSAARILV